MELILLAENTALENLLWSGLEAHFYVNGDWFCTLTYLEGLRKFNFLSDLGDQKFETIKEVLNEFYTRVPNNYTLEVELTS